jgi:hypothetical protein
MMKGMRMKGFTGMGIILLSLSGLAFGDSLNVRLIGRLDGTFADLWVSGDRVYVTDWTNYDGNPAPMRIIGVSDPFNPSQLSQFTHPSLANNYDIAVYGDYAYIANEPFLSPDSGIMIVDCSVPTNPVFAGVIENTTPITHTNFIVDHYLFSSNRVEIYDLLPDPTSPTFLVRIRDIDPNLEFAHEVSAIDTILYVSVSSDPPNTGVFLYNITDPSNPSFMGRGFDLPCGEDANTSWPADFDPRYVLHTDNLNCGILHMWDFEDPSTPVKLTDFKWRNTIVIHQIMTEGRYAYISSFYQGFGPLEKGGLLVLDISEPSCPHVAGFYDTPNAWGVDITEPPYIYISDSDSGLYVLEFSPPVAHDVEVAAVISPLDTITATCLSPYPISAVFCNNGDTLETYSVVAEILDSTGAPLYADTQTVANHQPDTCINVTFNDWVPGSQWCNSGLNCGFRLNVFPLLSGDQFSCNDTSDTDFCADFGPLGISEEPIPSLPSSFVLYRNKPNPFFQLTAISYALPGVRGQGSGISENIPVNLAIYDIMGRLVETLVDERQEPGVYQLQITSSQLPGSGVYFYKLESGTFSETKKLILLR